jgi:cysteinyl-tRNA synthetase
MIRVYNTLTQQKEPFEPVNPPQVGMYVCGPTVYSNSHIGHMVGPVIFDTIKRHLVHSGYDVTWVVNITDVDDKLIVASREKGTSVAELARAVTEDYLACLSALNVTGIDEMPRATQYIDEIIAITQGLVDRGLAYASGGDVYFDVTKDADYGKLSHRDPEELQAGARIEPTDLKRNPGDFALWKGSKPGEPFWESPWGPGRPGWHIECSAMSMKLLGQTFDIHGGGLDLVFPHHENEVAQSESYSDKPFARYWMHNGLLTNGGRKISKSDPNTIVLMSDLLAAYSPDAIRGLLLASHYRRPIDYGINPATGQNRIDEIDRGFTAFRNLFERFERLTGRSFYGLEAPERRDGFVASTTAFGGDVAGLRGRFLDAMDDDFNTGAALAELYDLVRLLNRFADQAGLEAEGAEGREALAEFEGGLVVLRELSGLLGLFREKPAAKASDADSGLTGSLLDLLVALRTELRQQKNYALADQIRKELSALGVTLEDRAGGTGWKVER